MKRFDSFMPGDRYRYDHGMCSYEKGYAQIDTKQDASYYGNWISPTECKAVCFAEGDLTIIEFDDNKEMVEWVQKFKDNEGLGFLGIDPAFSQELEHALITHGLEAFLH